MQVNLFIIYRTHIMLEITYLEDESRICFLSSQLHTNDFTTILLLLPTSATEIFIASTFFELLSFLSLVTFSLVLSLMRFASPDATFLVLEDVFLCSAKILSFSDDFLVCEDCLATCFFWLSSLVVDLNFDPAFAFFSKLFL